MKANWQPDYANSLLVFTDGKDEDDPGGISLATLQTELKAAADPAKPIQVIMLGYGEADIPAMTAIAQDGERRRLPDQHAQPARRRLHRFHLAVGTQLAHRVAATRRPELGSITIPAELGSHPSPPDPTVRW